MTQDIHCENNIRSDRKIASEKDEVIGNFIPPH